MGNLKPLSAAVRGARSVAFQTFIRCQGVVSLVARVTKRKIMEGLPLSVQELSRELSVFGIGQSAIQALKGKL